MSGTDAKRIEELLWQLAKSPISDMTPDRVENLLYGDILENYPDAYSMWERVGHLDYNETMRLLELQSRMSDRLSLLQEITTKEDEVAKVLKLILHDSENAQRHLASVLRRGDFHPDLLSVLAELLDPDGSGVGEKRLVIKRTRRGAPTRLQPELEDFIHLNCILFPHPNMEYVAATAMQRFGCARSTFFDVYRQHRECWAEDDLRRLRAVAENRRRQGDPDFQPLR